MSVPLALECLEQATRCADDVTITWHGGEPLLGGLDFYKAVAAKSRELRETGKRVRNSIQSNGTLISDEFLDFISDEMDFGLGLSLDGPKYYNDKTRVTKDGLGSFDAIMHTISRVKSYEGRGIKRRLGGGVICVVGKHNIHHLHEIYDFFKKERVDVAFNLLSPAGKATESMVPSTKECVRAYCDLFETWISDEDGIDVKPFSDIMRSLLSAKPVGCHASVSCADYFVSVGPQGDVYPCGRFDGEKKFWLGSIHEVDGLKKALTSPLRIQLQQRYAHIQSLCGACEFKPVCNGGCMHSAAIAGDIMREDPHCEFYYGLNSHIKARLQEELQNTNSGKCDQETRLGCMIPSKVGG